MLEVSNLSVSYHKDGSLPILHELSFRLEPGQVFAVAGPSGCGKSTLIHAMAGILTPCSGTIVLEGRPLEPYGCRIGFIPQNYGLLPWKTVKENCLFCARIKDGQKQDEAKLLDMCRRLGIEALLSRYPGTLSGGQAQRAALARAFFMKPELLLMDEPFAALDIPAASAAGELFLELWREQKPTACIITHRVEDALYLAGELAVMGRYGRFTYQSHNPWQGVKEPDEEGYRRLKQRFTDEIIKADAE